MNKKPVIINFLLTYGWIILIISLLIYSLTRILDPTSKPSNYFCDKEQTTPKINLCDFSNFKCELSCNDGNYTVRIKSERELLPCTYHLEFKKLKETIGCELLCPEPEQRGDNCGQY